MIRVKICGITNLEDALLASELGADALGFIFSKKSPRCISQQAAAKIIAKLDPFLIKVGVFVDQEEQAVLDTASNLGLDILQFHGSESPAYCNSFARKFKVIKVLFPQSSPYKKQLPRYNVDAFMFDLKYEQKSKGINTLSQDSLKELVKLAKKGKRMIVSGGLSLSNIAKIKKLNPYAVDVCSGVEKLVGKKDERLLREFINRVKK